MILVVILGVIFMLAGVAVFNLPVLMPDLVVNFDTNILIVVSVLLVVIGLIVIIVGAKAGDNTVSVDSTVTRKNEAIVTAVIKSFKDGKGKLVNGLPPITLEVEYFYNDEFHTIDVDTGEYDESVFPVGSELKLLIRGKHISILEED